jgi:hypothetical protein
MLVMFNTLSLYPPRVSLKNMSGHGPRWESNLWNTSPMLCQLRVYPGYTLRITSQASYTPEHMTPFYYIGSFQKTSIPPKGSHAYSYCHAVSSQNVPRLKRPRICTVKTSPGQNVPKAKNPYNSCVQIN